MFIGHFEVTQQIGTRPRDLREITSMIYTIVNVELTPGRRDHFLESSQGFLSEARNEEGCLEFEATIPHEPALALTFNGPMSSLK